MGRNANELRMRRAMELWEEGYRAMLQGELDSAIELFGNSIEVHPTAEAHTFRGWAFSFQGKVDEAIAECHKAIDVDPSFGNPYNDIGSYLMAKGELDEAIPWFERAKEAPRYEPRHFPYLNLGRVFTQKGLLRKALEEFKVALEIHPGDEMATGAVEALTRQLN